MNLKQAQQILEHRELSKLNDNVELQEKRRDWLEKLNLINSCNGYSIRKDVGMVFEIICYEGDSKICEMYEIDEEAKKTELEKSQFFNPKSNTRTKINSETCGEVDKLPFDKTIILICETLLSLIRNKVHFAVFYAEGQRSPHIRIYDFEGLNELNPQQRIKAQIQFWRKHFPFGTFHYVDTGMFVDDKTMQLEFAPHWKYGTPFNLLFEYLPEVEGCKS